MSTQTKTKSHEARGSRSAASIVWFEIPADNVERAKNFYSALFGWNIEKFPGVTDYWHIDTCGRDVAAAAYARRKGIKLADFLASFGKPMGPRLYGEYVATLLVDPAWERGTAFGFKEDTGIVALDD